MVNSLTFKLDNMSNELLPDAHPISIARISLLPNFSNACNVDGLE